MTTIRRLLAVPSAIAVALPLLIGSAASAHESPAPMLFCSSKIYNGCFYPEPAFRGPEYKTTVYSSGCWGIPDTRSYSLQVSRTVTFFAEPGCTGDAVSAPAGVSWNIDTGFTVRSYRY